MEEIQLTETEQRYFGDLFTCCDSDKTGKIPLYKASELFRSANLPLDVLKQITDLCAGRSSHIGRRQFYSALKLIAAFQAGLPLRPDLDVPLPRLSWPSSISEGHKIGKWEHHHIGRHQISPDLIQLSDTDRTPTPQKEPVTVVSVGDSNVEIHTDSPQHNGRSLSPVSGPGPKSRSPEASSTASDSPTPTNSVQERNWAATSHWHGLVCEEQRQLLGTEEESSDRHSSDDEGDAESEVWTITDEQREYYTAQFRSLQPDPMGLIAGPVARLFFEKSRLPVHELRKIWQLADVTKDGALSLDEFNTAMHLVVLRRNNIDLPESLPPSLVPPVQPPPPTAPPVPAAVVAPVEPPSREESPPSLSPPTGEPSSPPRSKEWTKFVDSPTSSVSSPGPKPVNFDFHKSAVEQDPKILHPVPLRVTPESQGLPPGEEEPCRSPRKLTEPQPIPYEQLGSEGTSPKKGVVGVVACIPPPVDNNSTSTADIRPIQRPQAKKPAAPGPGAIPPPPHPAGPSALDENNAAINSTQPTGVVHSGPTSLPMAAAQMGPKKEPPPPPPPRPYRTHARSSSLDLNRLGKTSNVLGTPPVVPPRISPSTTSPKKLIGQRSEGDVLALVGDQTSFADFAQFGQEEDAGDGPPVRRHGAFEVYRKPTTRSSGSDAALGLPEVESPSEDPPNHRHRPGDALRRLQEQNCLLVRVCQELSVELAEVQEERASLELQLEQLKSQAE
ncbi:ralBP1-associated Eps domain-containing protein 1 [Anabrus simplex]|uniref:ralBP1-associated Eps domain-containing protein 1 n=1 Tax=Anabrus simplex TaxID=316456 RepID=UPI0035A29EFE